MKEAKQFLQSVQIPGDAQSIVHAKQAGIKASDVSLLIIKLIFLTTKLIL